MPNYRLTLAYDGTDFHGWQSQPGERTVQDTLEAALAELFEPGIRVTAAGRTDAGVHALAMPASFAAFKNREPAVVVRALSAMLPPDVAVLDAVLAPDGFSARFSAKTRAYRYVVEHGGVFDPITRRFAWQIPVELDVDAVQNALPAVAGEHDFHSFQASGCSAKTSVRTVYRADLERTSKNRFTIEFEANGFLRGMVRSIVGTLVEIGSGRRPVEDLRRLIETPDRSGAGRTADARGLFFLYARYEDIG